jgi:nucleoid DNA-binding protein
MARNPRTGEQISIPETVVASFSPAKALKDKINGRTE